MPKRSHLLLHVCCGPCATAVIERLAPEFELACYWLNPNIEPTDEHERRLEAARVVACTSGVELIEGSYDNAGWHVAVAGLENEPEGGRRCAVCFEYRLRETANRAAADNFACFASTLAVSLHKDSETVRQIGERVAEAEGLRFIGADWSSEDGFARTIELSQRLGLYRQRYCGCLFAKRLR